MQVPKRRSEQAIKRDTGPVMITAAGLARWQKQLAQLEKDVPAMIKEVERTKEHGDFSENAAYQDAKHTLRRTYGRMDGLRDRIKRAVIIEKPSGASGQVQLGSTVVLETSGKSVTFEILGPQEANPSKGRISDQSPLGQALIGRSVGDTVSVPIKDGSIAYTITSIE